MLVYGDAARLEPVATKQRSVLAAMETVRCVPGGLRRHAALVAAFIALSELVQGIADAEWRDRGGDDRSSAQDAGMALLLELAEAIARSWWSGFEDQGELPTDVAARVAALSHPEPIEIKTAEGYAFYALYPECYLAAATRSGLGSRTQVIGIRSIGLGLAAMVATGIGAPRPVTVRPHGHPFQRQVTVAPALASDLLVDAGASYAVVDEGPGLSGSSFGAVADWLEAHGVARDRIHVFPSHLGDLGPQASAAHRERWSAARRHCIGMDDLLLSEADPARRLDRWLSAMLGPLEEPLQEVSGGGWRRLRFVDEADWPPCNVQQERRKFVARTGDTRWLVKFAGLGAEGERKLATALLLQEAGFSPEVAGLCHGFLVQRWHDAGLLRPHAYGRERLVARMGDYLAFRASRLPAHESAGATLADLREMAAHNTQLALGAEAAAVVKERLSGEERIESRLRRVHTDNRLHLWEWLVLEDGRLLKADALDHSAAHDLIGCQDIAWDVAGAVVELDLTEDEGAALTRRIQQATERAVDADVREFLMPCYLAFQLGAATLAADVIGGAEADRLRRAATVYADRLSEWVGNRSTSPEPG